MKNKFYIYIIFVILHILLSFNLNFTLLVDIIFKLVTFSEYEKGVSKLVQVIVHGNNVDQALRALKKKMQREGIFREMKMGRHFEKPSEERVRKKAESLRRRRKLDRKRMNES